MRRHGARQAQSLFVPKNRYELLSFLYEQGEVTGRQDGPDGCRVQARLSEKDLRRFEKLLKGA